MPPTLMVIDVLTTVRMAGDLGFETWVLDDATEVLPTDEALARAFAG
jgi:nicotinamidase-related amidase